MWSSVFVCCDDRRIKQSDKNVKVVRKPVSSLMSEDLSKNNADDSSYKEKK